MMDRTADADAAVIVRAMALSRGDAEARRWYAQQPLPGFGGQTAEALVRAGRGDAVLEYLARLGAGGYA